MKPTRVAVVGCGLVGGSVALALARSGDHHVTAIFDSDPATAVAAVESGAAERAAASIADAVADADVVVVGVAVSDVAATVVAALDAAPPTTIVTDVGSVKAPIVAAVEARLAPAAAARFCGGHPMAGSERQGFGAADAELFGNAVWVLTPTPATEPDAITRVARLASATGASPLSLPPDVHDAIVAVVSHVPHLAAATLMNVAQGRAGDAPVLRLAAGGFRDVTRIAAGSPRVWEDILAENASAVRDVLDAYIGGLRAIRDDLGDRAALRATLEAASKSRRELPIPEVAAELASLVVAISDRPGAFAEIANVLGAAGINIVDVELRHSAEGGRGLLQVTVAASHADGAVAALAGHGHAARVEGAVW